MRNKSTCHAQVDAVQPEGSGQPFAVGTCRGTWDVALGAAPSLCPTCDADRPEFCYAGTPVVFHARHCARGEVPSFSLVGRSRSSKALHVQVVHVPEHLTVSVLPCQPNAHSAKPAIAGSVVCRSHHSANNSPVGCHVHPAGFDDFSERATVGPQVLRVVRPVRHAEGCRRDKPACQLGSSNPSAPYLSRLALPSSPKPSPRRVRGIHGRRTSQAFVQIPLSQYRPREPRCCHNAVCLGPTRIGTSETFRHRPSRGRQADRIRRNRSRGGVSQTIA